MKSPTSLIICGIRYSVEYVEDMVEVDIDKRVAKWGEIDYHARSIRVWKGKGKHRRQIEDQFDTLLHEIMHGVIDENRLIKAAIREGMEHDFIDNFASVMADTLIRNGMIK